MLTSGSIRHGLIRFLIPILLANLLQQLYNTVDTLCIGYFLDTNDLAAMGTTMALFELMMGLAQGFGSGISIVVSHAAGAKKDLSIYYWQAFILSFLLGLVLTGFGPFSRSFLVQLGTPHLLVPKAQTYLSIIGFGMMISVFYNLLASLYRAIGDSKTPLYALGIASLVNTLLDILLIPMMGIAGAAVATVIAQMVSIIVILTFARKVQLKRPFIWKSSILKEMFQQGLSMAMMFSIVSLGTLMLQTGINQLDTIVIASHTASRKWFSILALPISSLAVSVTTFVSQNKGAGHWDRLRKGVQESLKMGIAYSIFIATLVWLWAKELLILLTSSHDPTLLYWGSWYLRIGITFFMVLSCLLLLRNTLQSLGYKLLPLISSVIELAGKLLFSLYLVPVLGYWGVIWCEPLIWVAMCLQLAWAYRSIDSA